MNHVHLIIQDSDLAVRTERHLRADKFSTTTTSSSFPENQAPYLVADAIVIDLVAADEAAFDLLSSIHSSHPPIPIIVIVGSLNDDDGVDALKLGADAYVRRPVNQAELAELIGLAYAVQQRCPPMNCIRDQ